jgi:hypothetical protein
MMSLVEVPEPQRSGILVIRAWIDDPEATGLRARIIYMLDALGPDPTETVAAGSADVLAVVERWLEALR